MANVIKNVWDKISIHCMNHDKAQEMELISNTEQIKTPFICCSDRRCPNRLNLDDYQGICLKLMHMIDCDPIADHTNSKFDYKGIRQKVSVKVLKYSDSDIRLGILNRTVLGI